MGELQTFRCLRCEQDKPSDLFDIRTSTGKRKKWCRPCCRAGGRQTSAALRKVRQENSSGKDYGSRNANLRRLGFASYAEYLQSELWRTVRAMVYAVKGRSCYLCNCPATEVHHNRYHERDLKGEQLRYVNPVCRACHEGIEFDAGQKTTLRRAKTKFKRQRRSHLRG